MVARPVASAVVGGRPWLLVGSSRSRLGRDLLSLCWLADRSPNRDGCCVVRVETTTGGLMPNYMLLLYAPEVGPDEQAEREAQMPLWVQLNESLEEAGLL